MKQTNWQLDKSCNISCESNSFSFVWLFDFFFLHTLVGPFFSFYFMFLKHFDIIDKMNVDNWRNTHIFRSFLLKHLTERVIEKTHANDFLFCFFFFCLYFYSLKKILRICIHFAFSSLWEGNFVLSPIWIGVSWTGKRHLFSIWIFIKDSTILNQQRRNTIDFFSALLFRRISISTSDNVTIILFLLLLFIFHVYLLQSPRKKTHTHDYLDVRWNIFQTFVVCWINGYITQTQWRE